LRLKILKKLRTASLNSEFTGSYKKKRICINVTKYDVTFATLVATSLIRAFNSRLFSKKYVVYFLCDFVRSIWCRF